MSFKSTLLVLVTLCGVAFAQTTITGTPTGVKVHINTGNPKFPFPQFQPYQNQSATLYNLATYSGVGVTHAEMDTVIRDAYQIMMNRANKPGGGVGGIDYIQFVSVPFCSEGDGYAMLAAVAMADKPTFDGLWLWVHDNAMHKVKRYSDCKESSPLYSYSRLPGGWNTTGLSDNAATDGDVDIGMALLCAYYQWGDSMGINDACGNPISYKNEAIEFLKGMTDTLPFDQSLGANYLCGDIGFDGYIKGGDTQGELTAWANNTAQTGISKPPTFAGPIDVHIDYAAPAYFHAFAEFLSNIDSSKYAWNIRQFRRAEASSDWIIGKLYQNNPRNIPFAGYAHVASDNAVSFTQFNEGEDFRFAWRTVLNFVWHGNSETTWDPVSHQVKASSPNTFERDIGQRFAKFLWNNTQSPWNNECVRGANKTFAYWGPSVLWTDWDVDGGGGNFFFQNWIQGTGSMSAVTSQDFNLMAEMYRQLEIEWNVQTAGDGYLTSLPVYYHGWFRLLGMLMLTGNYHSPLTINHPTANMKVYLDIDKSFAFQGDTVTYTIDYRNFGSVDASNVTITDVLHNDFVFVSATGGGSFNQSNHTVTWNVGSVPGFKTDNGITPTKGQFKLKVIVGNATQKQYRNKVEISCSNGTGWTSNEYPNNITPVMERNYLDIAKRALIIKKTASATRIKPGTSVQFTINFENTSEAGWINGGRPGVHFSFSQTGDKNGTGSRNSMRFRLFHDAQEAYIDFGNYRVSYFLYDSLITRIGASGNNPGWSLTTSIKEGVDSLMLLQEMITPGSDSLGKWNQRLIVQFSDPSDPKRVPRLTTIDHHLSEYRGLKGIRIHRGEDAPLRLVWFLNNTAYTDINWSDDWSWDPKIAQDDADVYVPVTNDWTNPEKPDIPVNTWNQKACTTSVKNVNNILVEEWDGYTWRRVAGNGPLPGRDAINVVIRDTVPQGMTFVNFDAKPTIGTTTVTGNVISWTIPKLQIKQGGTITYTAKADGTCPGAADLDVVDRAWISADKESPFADSSLISISCDSVPKPPTPDHLDIVLDTNSIDKKHDALIESIDIDENTTNAKIYAAVRDKKGNFLSWANASWISSNPAIGTVSSFDTLTGLVTRINSGTITITVNQNGLKSDSITVYVAQLPPWPVITSTKMLDTNADVIPDLLTITLSDTFHLNQKLDSVVVNYLGKTYSIPVANTVLAGKSLTVPFASLSGVDPTPSGFSNLIMTVNNARKTHSKVFDDGVCPAIKSCLLLDNNGVVSKDTLSLKFYEPVTVDNLTGATLLLIHKGTTSTDTISLGVTIVNGGGGLSDSARVTVTGAVRPQAGDLLRFVPGVSGNTVADEAGNTPHLLNRAVVIRTKPPQIKSAMYTDKNGDGTVETVYLAFNKDVDPTDLNISLNWGGIGKLDSLKYPQFSTDPTSASTIVISLPDQFANQFPLKTSGNMYLIVGFLSSNDAPQTVPAVDGAAPVLISGNITPGVSFETIDNSDDTLRVAFSEKVNIAQAANPFFIQRTGLPADTMDLKLLYVKNDSAVYLVSGYHGFLFPLSGDSLWIRPGTISDAAGVWQNVPENHKVAITVKPPKMKWQVLMGPNPICLKDPNAKITISIKPLGKTRGTLSVKANISIYDALGNIVVNNAEFKNPTGYSPAFTWNGRNRNGRYVGAGTYLGMITFGDGTQTQIVKIGVRR